MLEIERDIKRISLWEQLASESNVKLDGVDLFRVQKSV